MDESLKQSIQIAEHIYHYLQHPETGYSKELDEWLSLSEKHHQLLNSLIQGDNFTKILSKCESIDEQQEWKSFYSKLAKQKKGRTAIRTHYFKHSLWRWSSIAAAVIIPLLCVIFIMIPNKETFTASYRPFNGQNVMPANNKATLYTYQNKQQCIVVPKGNKYSLTLEDGTKVWLNADSRLTYSNHFDRNKRIVRIEGEAFFDVAHDRNRPFYVMIGSVQVHVTGTAFNIRYFPKEQITSVVLTRGKIQMEDTKGKVLANLQPAKQFVMNNRTLNYQIKTADIDNQTAWKDNKFAFDNERLEDIAAELGRWYNINIVVDNTLSNHRYSGSLSRNEPISSIIRIIKQTEELDFVTDENNTVHIINANRK